MRGTSARKKREQRVRFCLGGSEVVDGRKGKEPNQPRSWHRLGCLAWLGLAEPSYSRQVPLGSSWPLMAWHSIFALLLILFSLSLSCWHIQMHCFNAPDCPSAPFCNDDELFGGIVISVGRLHENSKTLNSVFHKDQSSLTTFQPLQQSMNTGSTTGIS